MAVFLVKGEFAVDCILQFDEISNVNVPLQSPWNNSVFINEQTRGKPQEYSWLKCNQVMKLELLQNHLIWFVSTLLPNQALKPTEWSVRAIYIARKGLYKMKEPAWTRFVISNLIIISAAGLAPVR